MDLCFRYCRVVVKKDCSRTKPSALWAEDNKCKLPNPPQLPWTDMRYSMFQKVIHRSGLPGCADIIVLAEVGLPTLIRHHPPPWKYRQKQADDKIFHSFVCAAEIPCPQSNVRKLKKKKKQLKRAHLIWFFPSPPSFTMTAICSRYQPQMSSGLSLNEVPHLASLMFLDFSMRIAHWAMI